MELPTEKWKQQSTTNALPAPTYPLSMQTAFQRAIYAR
jgi:hypothetical protein